jgi:hypothetical protein
VISPFGAEIAVPVPVAVKLVTEGVTVAPTTPAVRVARPVSEEASVVVPSTLKLM